MSGATNLYTALLFLPAAGFFLDNALINSHASFLLMAALLVVGYFSHSLSFGREWLNVVRRCLGCLSTAVLILIVSAEVGEIITVVYQIEFGEEVSFLLKMVLMLSNMEGNLDLCASNEHHAKHPHHDAHPTAHIV
jgi:hypothetical protein